MHLPFSSLRSRKLWQRLAFTAVASLTVLAVLWLAMDFQGRMAWNGYRKEATARGVKLEFKEFLPAPVPDEENFGAVPLLVDSLSLDPARRERARQACELPSRRISTYNLLYQGFVEDGVIVPSGDKAGDMLKVFERYEPVLEPLRAAVNRPHAQLVGGWDSVFDGTFYDTGACVTPLCSILGARVVALLEKGRTAEALLDCRVMARLADLLDPEPTLMAAMVQMIAHSGVIGATQAGIERHRWGESELAALDGVLGQVDSIASGVRAFESERASLLTALDLFRADPKIFTMALSSSFKPNPSVMERVLSMLPRGWFESNKVQISRWYDRVIADMAEGSSRSASRANDGPTGLGRHYWIFYGLATMNTGNIPADIRSFQIKIDLTRVAIALERYLLQHGKYPAELNALSIPALRTMPAGEAPRLVRYELAVDHFKLHSNGANGRDEKGAGDDVGFRLAF